MSGATHPAPPNFRQYDPKSIRITLFGAEYRVGEDGALIRADAPPHVIVCRCVACVP